MKSDRLFIVSAIVGTLALFVGIGIGGKIGYEQGAADGLAGEIEKLGGRIDALGEEIRGLTEKLAEAKALVWTNAVASYYGADHKGRLQAEHGRLTASGLPFSAYGRTWASPGQPFGTFGIFMYRGRVTAGICTDRGPADSLQRHVDLSYMMAHDLGILRQGVVRLQMAQLAPGGRP